MTTHTIRTAVHCRYCNLNQYETGSRKCRRCGKWLYKSDEEKEEVEREDGEGAGKQLIHARGFIPPPSDSYSFWLPLVLTALRELNGMSQQDYALRIGVTRQYLSRIERGHTTPYVRLLPRFTYGLDISVYELIALCEECIRVTERG